MRVLLLLAGCLWLAGCQLWYGGHYRKQPETSESQSRPSPLPPPPPAETRPDADHEAVVEPRPPVTSRPRYKIPLHPELRTSLDLMERAAEQPAVQENFTQELNQARALLDRAIEIWIDEKGKLDEDDEEWWELHHLNYLAYQRTAVVVMKARALDAREALAGLQRRRAVPLKPAQPTMPAPAPAPASPVLSTDLPAQLQDLRPRQDPRGLILTLDERYFAPGQAQLLGDPAHFDALVEYLIANPGKNVACEGHSSDRDDDAGGQRLSLLRARVVQQALLERGLEFSRVTAVGYGGTRPLVSNGMVLGRSARVEIVISETTPADFSTGAP